VLTRKPREIAFRVLQQRERGAEFIEDALEDLLPSMAAVDRRLCQELVYGAVRWQATLDWLVARKTEGRTQKAPLQILLRLGLYQMFWLDRVPDHAAVNESVELARQAGFGAQSGFLNALLRGYARERESAVAALAELRSTDPARGYSHPAWLCERWHARWGDEDLHRLLDWNNQPPRTFARANLLRTDPTRLIEQWRQENVDYDFFRRDWTGENLVFELKSLPPLVKLPSFKQGGFYLQDPSTLLSVQMLDPQPGDRILDLCAAPGGKTTYLAQRLNNQALIVACDASALRLDRLRENCTRLGVTCVEPVTRDALPQLVVGHLPYDRVLVDAPCSNTGVMRRRVEVRWRVTLAEIERLQRAQLELLRAAAPHLRSGGRLVYSTCSLEPEENREVVTRFLADHPGFSLEQDRELVPFRDGVDGAYVACLRREPIS
jgi:16S rRNA (cytosine967-C5)-methyltransferase